MVPDCTHCIISHTNSRDAIVSGNVQIFAPTFIKTFLDFLFQYRSRIKYHHYILQASMRTYTDLELFALKCWATDSEDADGKPMKELITNGCVAEKSLEIKKQFTPIKTRFSFDAFRYHLPSF